MRIQCSHGFFIIRDEASYEISKFTEIFGLDISSFRDFYTFDFLLDAKNYSILGNPYLGVPAIKTFEGDPWEVMRKNKLIYDFNLGLVKPILSVAEKLSIKDAGAYYVSNGLVVPGSITDDGSRVTDYSARFLFDSMSFRYSEVSVE